MALQWRTTTHAAKQTRAGVLVTQRILVSDMLDVPLVEHYWSSVFVGGTTIPADLGPELRDHTFPEEARTQPVGEYTFNVTRDQAFRYAGASGDHAPHAIDDEAARADGYRSKIMPVAARTAVRRSRSKPRPTGWSSSSTGTPTCGPREAPSDSPAARKPR